jgi:hypothetical protein
MDHKGWYLPVINEAMYDLVYDLFDEKIREDVKGWWTARLNNWDVEPAAHGLWCSNSKLFNDVQAMASKGEMQDAVSAILDDMFVARRDGKIREVHETPEVAERFSKALAFLLHAAEGKLSPLAV